MTEVTTANHPARKWLGLLFAVPAVALMMLFDHFGASQYLLISLISIMALSFAVWENRSYHKEFWFWFMLLIFTGIHLLLVLMVGEHRWLTSAAPGAGHGVAFLALLDGLVITAFIRFPDWITSSLKYIYSDDQGGSSDEQKGTTSR
jgi:hypothetical protein